MKQHLLHIILLPALFSLSGLFSCSSGPNGMTDTDAELPLSAKRIKIVLSSVPTRATTDGVEEYEGCGNEYYIAPTDIEVLIYRTDGTLAERMEKKTVVPITGHAGQYELTGELKQLTTNDLNSSCKVVVLANLQSAYPTYFPYGRLYEWNEAEIYRHTRFEYAGSADFTAGVLNGTRTSTEKCRIPLWGVTTLKLGDYIYNILNETSKKVVEMDLLRALAKVEVYLDDSSEADASLDGLFIREVTLNRGRTDGFLTPKDAADWRKTCRVTEENAIASLNAGTSTMEADTYIPFYRNPADGHFYIYIPEQKASTSDAPAAFMTVTLGKEREPGDDSGVTVDAFDYPLYFSDYGTSPATPFPVLRNWWYQYRIVGVGKGQTIHYMICKWGKKNSDIDFH